MSEITITLAVDVPAYATVKVPSGTELSNEALERLIRSADEECEYEPYWEAVEGLRIVSAVDQNENPINELQDISIDSHYSYFGRQAELFLRGKIPLEEFVSAAKTLKIINDESQVAYSPKTILEVLKSGGAIELDNGYRFKGDPENNYIDLFTPHGDSDGLVLLNEEGLNSAYKSANSFMLDEMRVQLQEMYEFGDTKSPDYESLVTRINEIEASMKKGQEPSL